ncbi:MAG TPA: hypothetical protein VFC02_08590, partial [Anaerolineales bacterium]|nr:hypothetical protein [Anaerolineales bacterium]
QYTVRTRESNPKSNDHDPQKAGMDLSPYSGKLGCPLRGKRFCPVVNGGTVKMEIQMEMVTLGLMILSLIIVIAIDTTQKRRRFLVEGK